MEKPKFHQMELVFEDGTPAELTDGCYMMIAGPDNQLFFSSPEGEQMYFKTTISYWREQVSPSSFFALGRNMYPYVLELIVGAFGLAVELRDRQIPKEEQPECMRWADFGNKHISRLIGRPRSRHARAAERLEYLRDQKRELEGQITALQASLESSTQ